jgi:hypothetical protein
MSRYRRIERPDLVALEPGRGQPDADADGAPDPWEVTTHCGPSGTGVEALRTPR